MNLIKKKERPNTNNKEHITPGITKKESDNITERANREEYIGHLAAIVESSDDAIISKSLDGIIRSWNKGSEKMFGYSSEQAVGKHISLIIPQEYSDEEKKIIERIRNNEIIDHFETIRTKKNNERFYVSLTVSPIKDRTGTIIGVSKIVRDISSRKKLEEEYIQANKELVFQNKEKEKRAAELIIANKELVFQSNEKEKRADELIIANKELASQNEAKIIRTAQLEAVNQELESFSYSVSHDLRAPLRAIHGYAQMLKEIQENQTDQEANRMLNNIIFNAKKMGQLIDDLLSFSRLGRKELNYLRL